MGSDVVGGLVVSVLLDEPPPPQPNRDALETAKKMAKASLLLLNMSASFAIVID